MPFPHFIKMTLDTAELFGWFAHHLKILPNDFPVKLVTSLHAPHGPYNFGDPLIFLMATILWIAKYL